MPTTEIRNLILLVGFGIQSDRFGIPTPNRSDWISKKIILGVMPTTEIRNLILLVGFGIQSDPIEFLKKLF